MQNVENQTKGMFFLTLSRSVEWMWLQPVFYYPLLTIFHTNIQTDTQTRQEKKTSYRVQCVKCVFHQWQQDALYIINYYVIVISVTGSDLEIKI